MIYSVPKPDWSGYTYYEGPGSFPPVGEWRKPRGSPINGMWPSTAFLPILPSGATKTGEEGTQAQGIIAVLPQGILEGLPEPVKAAGKSALWFGAGWMLKRWLNGKKRKR